MLIRTDLHVHSCLSPCGDLHSSPRALVAAARDRNLDIVALTDHNTAENVGVFSRLSLEAGLVAIPGIELATVEEVHVVCLFADAETAVSFGREVYHTLPETGHDPARFGDQVIVDENDMIQGELEKSLFGASSLTLEDAFARVRTLGGLFIPAHIDRATNSILSQLGFVPDLPFDAVEVVGTTPPPGLEHFCSTAASDAHRPEDVGRRYIEFNADLPAASAEPAPGSDAGRAPPPEATFDSPAAAFDALVGALRANCVRRVFSPVR